MRMRWVFFSLAALAMVGAAHAETADPVSLQTLAQIVPGHTTEAQLQSLLGAPWRVVQFNDCGQAMDGQGDETWEYRLKGQDGAYRLHVEFDDRGIVHLIAEIPDKSDDNGTIAVIAPAQAAMCLSM